MGRLTKRCGEHAVPVNISIDFALDMDDKTWNGLQAIFDRLADYEENEIYTGEELKKKPEPEQEQEQEYPKAVFKYYNQRDFEAVYRCPNCCDSFSDVSFNYNGRRCPNCKTKLSGIPW